jgi:hypothetical protein
LGESSCCEMLHGAAAAAVTFFHLCVDNRVGSFAEVAVVGTGVKAHVMVCCKCSWAWYSFDAVLIMRAPRGGGLAPALHHPVAPCLRRNC